MAKPIGMSRINAESTSDFDLEDSVVIPAGTILLRQGEPGDCAYMLLEGKMFAVRKGKNGLVPLGEIVPVNIVGENSLIGDKSRTVTVVAKVDCKVVKLSRHRLITLIRRYPDIAEIMVKVLCHRLVETTERLSEVERKPERPEAKREAAPVAATNGPKNGAEAVQSETGSPASVVRPKSRMAAIQRRRSR